MELCEATGGLFVPGVPLAKKKKKQLYLFFRSDDAERICNDPSHSVVHGYRETCNLYSLYFAY